MFFPCYCPKGNQAYKWECSNKNAQKWCQKKALILTFMSSIARGSSSSGRLIETDPAAPQWQRGGTVVQIIGWTRLLPNHIYCGLNHQVVRLFQKLVNECLKLCHSCRAKGKSSCGFTKCSGCLQFQALKAHIHKCHLSTSSCQYSKSLNAMKTNQQTSLYQEAFSCRGTLGLEVLGHSQAPWKERGKGQAFWEARSQPLHSSITDFWLGKGNH